MSGDHGAQRIHNRSHHFLWILRRDDRFLGDDIAAKIRHGNPGQAGMDIEGQYPTLAVDVEKGRPAPTWNLPSGAFDYPAFVQQFFNNERNRAALQPRTTRQVCPRDGLPDSNLIEDEIPVDLARHLVRCAPMIVRNQL